MRPRISQFLIAAGLSVLSGCTLYNDVSIAPLIMLPTTVDRGSDVHSMIRKADYLRAIEMASTIDARQRHSANDLGALGSAYLAAGRYDDAREHLRAALDLGPYRDVYAQIAWNLSQVEYLQNNYDASLEWAQLAIDHGLTIKKWHLDYLTALSRVPVYTFEGLPSDELPMHTKRPDVPRVGVRLNKNKQMTAVIDSGAVLSIISQRLANEIPVKKLGTFQGTFYGLLGEPIAVDFALLDTLEIGAIVIHNVPVAIMPDDKMKFLAAEKNEFNIDFLLGANLLKEFRLELDYSRDRVTFTRLTMRDRVPDAQQNLFFENFRPLVRGTVNRKGWFLFVLDTGSEVTFLNESQTPNLPVNFFTPGMHSATLQGLGGAKKHGSKLENVQVGVDKWSGTFKTIPMYSSVEQEHAAGIIGENFLQHFNVVIDFGRMRLDLVRRR